MSDEKISNANSELVDHSNSSAPEPVSNEIAGRTGLHWPLSTLMAWVLGPVACVVVANQIVGGLTFRPLPVTSAIQAGAVTTGLLFLLMYLPLWWLFNATGLRLAARMSVIFVVSLLFTCVLSPRFILSAWGSIFLLAIPFCVFSNRIVVLQNRSGAVWASVTMLLTVGLHTVWMELWPSSELRRLRELRTEFPLDNIADRIERLGRAPESSASLSTQGRQLQQRLQIAYDQQPTYSPFHSPKLVHDAQFERFVRSPGFGPIRMNPRWIRLWAKPKSLAESKAFQGGSSGERSDYDFDFASTFRILSLEPSESAEKLTPATSHVWTFWDFLHPTTLGEAFGPQAFVGFRAHSVTYTQSVLFESERFELEKLELIGLLMHDVPVVYEIDGLPNMESIVAGDMATRELNTFESESLQKLRDGESIVIERDGPMLKMVGALPAIEQCHDCHQSKSGEILGALSYVFRPSARRPQSFQDSQD
ncbi:MAG: hypothetical protein JNL67_17780 [Planctomycetaceae bacterium]|nr:hypothetical protein [Planctomycetaceae bacterium]